MAHQFILNVNSRDAYPQVLEAWNALMLQNDEEDINQAVAVVLQIEQMHENGLNDGSVPTEVDPAQAAVDWTAAQQGWKVSGANQYTGGFVTGGWDDDDNNGASNNQASNNGESITTNDGAVGEENIIRGMGKTTLENATEPDAMKADNDAPALTGGTSSGKSDIRDYFRIAEDTQWPPAPPRSPLLLHQKLSPVQPAHHPRLSEPTRRLKSRSSAPPHTPPTHHRKKHTTPPNYLSWPRNSAISKRNTRAARSSSEDHHHQHQLYRRQLALKAGRSHNPAYPPPPSAPSKPLPPLLRNTKSQHR